MRLVILGSGTGIPVKHRGYAGIYLKVGREHWVWDAGPGTLKQLVALNVTYLDLDRIFLTHFHPDHCLDVVSMLFAMRIPWPARTKPLTIYGPPGLRQLVRRLSTAFSGWITPNTYRLTIREVGQTRFRIGRAAISTRRMQHSKGALGYRVQAGGRAVAYSGDTDSCQGIVELGRRADLLILECSMPDDWKVKGHLTPTECGRIAAEANCKHLVLTHFYPIVKLPKALKAIRRQYGGKVTLGRDLLRVSV